MHLSINLIDLGIVIAYLVGIVVFGIWIGRTQKDLSDYLLGNRDLPWWAILGSIVATETSTVTFLSIPGLAYETPGGDLRFLQLPLGYILGRILVALFFLPHFFRGEIFSAYQVLTVRFGGATRKVASLMFIVMRTLADGLRLFLTAVVLQQVTGIELVTSIVLTGGATILYTFCGGIRSVVWSDCIQLVVYLAGAVLAGAIILQSVPGEFEGYLAFARAHDKFRWVDPTFDFTRPYTLWAGVLGGMFLALATHGADQLMVQRYLCSRNQSDAARALVTSGFFVAAQFLLFLLLGIGLACFYTSYPPEEPLRKDAAFAHFIVHHLPTGAVGLTVAAVLSAAMSTLSSSLNSLATATLNDFGLVSSEPRQDDAHSRSQIWLGRGLTAVFGALQVGVAILGRNLEKSVVDSVLSIAGFSTGIVLGVFFLGILTRRVTQPAALVGLVGGLAIMTWIAFGTSLAWPWYTIVGSLSTFTLGVTADALGIRQATTPDHGRTM